MSYYFNKTIVSKNFDEVIQKVTEELKKVGFGILTEINVKETLKKKINVDIKKYMILGACNPQFAHKALQLEDKLGVLLPCNIIVQEHENDRIEVSAVDPIASMSFVDNEALGGIAIKIQQKLMKFIENLD